MTVVVGMLEERQRKRRRQPQQQQQPGLLESLIQRNRSSVRRRSTKTTRITASRCCRPIIINHRHHPTRLLHRFVFFLWLLLLLLLLLLSLCSSSGSSSWWCGSIVDAFSWNSLSSTPGKASNNKNHHNGQSLKTIIQQQHQQQHKSSRSSSNDNNNNNNKSTTRNNKSNQKKTSSLIFDLQKCTTPLEVLQTVGTKLTPNLMMTTMTMDSSQRQMQQQQSSNAIVIASLTLVRLSKLLMTLQNEHLYSSSSRVVGTNDAAANGSSKTIPRIDDNNNHHHSKKKDWNDQIHRILLHHPRNEENHNYDSNATVAAIFPQIIQTLVSTTNNPSRTSTTTNKNNKTPVPLPPTAAVSAESIEAIVEGTKAVAVLARLIPDIITLEAIQPVLQYWKTIDETYGTGSLQEHQLSGLHWAYACFHHVHGGDGNSASDDNNNNNNCQLPTNLQKAYQEHCFPFCIIPGCFAKKQDLTVVNLVAQTPFQVDTIQTTSTRRTVPERRETAWLGDETVAPFAYSGKTMPRHPWSPLVKEIRDDIQMAASSTTTTTATQDSLTSSRSAGGIGVYYDGCLLNHYPDGGSAMRYHCDPDQGTLWDFSTAVVSVGASRRVAFRPIIREVVDDNRTLLNDETHNNSKETATLTTSPSTPPPPPSEQSQNNPKTNKKTPQQQQQQQPHTFVVMHGDVMEMVDDCQSRFQHAVKPAEDKREQAARASLVFKRTLGLTDR